MNITGEGPLLPVMILFRRYDVMLLTSRENSTIPGMNGLRIRAIDVLSRVDILLLDGDANITICNI